MGAKNYDFVQLDRGSMDKVRQLISENPTAANIFMFLSKQMNVVNAVSCSQQLLQEMVNRSRVTVARAIKHLEDGDFINVLKQGNCNVYVMNPDVVWASHKYNRKYCEFNGKMLVSKKENANVFNKRSFNTLVAKADCEKSP